MDNTDQFLDLYKQIEYTGKSVYFPNMTDSENVIGRLINHPSLAKHKEELNYCRVVRNFLTHNPKVGGSYPIEPSLAMLEFLQKILLFIENPPKALEYAVKRKQMVIAHKRDFVVDLLTVMRQNAFTHAPVIENGKLIGIFSDELISAQLCGNGSIKINAETTVDYLAEYMSLELQHNQCFHFVSADASISQVESLFEDNYTDRNLVSVVYITQSGKKSEKILGMITPWDILKYN